METIKTYKTKIKPTKEQAAEFERYLGICRYLYNMCLEYNNFCYSGYGFQRSELYGMPADITTEKDKEKYIKKNRYKFVKMFALSAELTQAKQAFPFLATVSSSVLINVLDRVELAFKKFFDDLKKGKKAGFPKFRGKHTYNSFCFKADVKIKNGKLVLPKISSTLGDVEFASQKYIPITDIRTATIYKEYDGWYISMSVKEDVQPMPKTGLSVGIDVGLAHLLTDSYGHKVDNPKFYTNAQRRLRILQRKVSRAKKGSNNRKRAVALLARCHGKVSRQRRAFLHEVTSYYVSKYDVIHIEDLRIMNMVKNDRLSKSILDSGWGMFRSMLESKCAMAGRTLNIVEARDTSKTCNSCGAKREKLSLSVREWTCEACGAHHDRDENAAKNILERPDKKAKKENAGVVIEKPKKILRPRVKQLSLL